METEWRTLSVALAESERAFCLKLEGNKQHNVFHDVSPFVYAILML